VNEECSCEDTPKNGNKKKGSVEVMPEIKDGAHDDSNKKSKKYVMKAMKSQSVDK